MTRQTSNFVYNDRTILTYLENLANKSIEPERYREVMEQLGNKLGQIILNRVIDSSPHSLYLASTVEDADFLAKGIILQLENHFSNIGYACFWNKRFSPFGISDLKVAPILKKYQEPSPSNIDYLIIVKSIISGACVVKTNLVNLIQKINPNKILIVAPVMYINAEEKLKIEFEPKISNKFEFIYFAKDDQRTSDGEVIPGIGGSVYERLGFQGQDDKNTYIPELVRSRRARLVSA
jgi:hypothetical protein